MHMVLDLEVCEEEKRRSERLKPSTLGLSKSLGNMEGSVIQN